MSLWPCGKCQKANCLFEAICSQEMWPKTTLGGICLFKKTLMLYCFCSEAIINQAASLFEQSRLTVDGRELPTWTSQWNPKKWTMKYRNNHWFINNTLETPRMNAKNFISCHFLGGNLCVFGDCSDFCWQCWMVEGTSPLNLLLPRCSTRKTPLPVQIDSNSAWKSTQLASCT